MAAKRDASGRPSALEVTNALLKLSVEQTKELVFQLGVPLQDIDDILHRGGVLVKARLVQKWLDMYASASWEQLVSALRRISMDSLAVEIERTYVPRAGNALDIQTPATEDPPVSSVAPQAAHPPEPTSTQDMSSTPDSDTVFPTTQDSTLQQPALTSRGAVADEMPTKVSAERTSKQAQIPQIPGKRKFNDCQITLFRSETLGSGAYGDVCKAKCDNLPCVAKIFHATKLKIPHPDPSSYLHGLWEELASARHPNLVQYLGPCGDPEIQLPLLLMELCDENLNNFLGRSPRPLPYHIQINICHDIALAVEYLHTRDIVHSNLTGSNVLMVAGAQAKITDFGLSEFSTVDLRMRPSSTYYMSPDAIDKVKSHLMQSNDIFSFGVITIQILTRQPPNPTKRLEQVYVSQFEEKVTVTVPETKRREAHLQIIPDTHPLKPLAVRCLKKERPSAKWFSERLLELKQSQQYTAEIQGTVISQELHLVKQQLKDLTEAKTKEAEEHFRQVQEMQHTIELLNRQIQENDCTIEQQKAMEEKLQHYLSVIVARGTQIEENLREIEAKDDMLKAKLKIIAEREKEVKEVERELNEAKKQESRLRQGMQQKDKTIQKLQTIISARDKAIQQLRQQQQPLKMLDIERTEGRSAPEKMFRGAAVVHGDIAYFRPVNSHKVYSYTNIHGIDSWSQLTDNPNWNSGLAVVNRLLTSVGGATNGLLSLMEDGGRLQWLAILPPMPTQRSRVACVATKQALVVAGGYAGDRPLDTVEVMGIDTRQWTTACPLPYPWSDISAVSCQESIYLAGGSHDSKTVFACSLSDLISGPQEYIWKTICRLPVAQSTLTSFKGHLLAVGGLSDLTIPSTEIGIYNPHTDSWNILDQMNVRRSQCLAVALPSNHLIIVGGITRSGQPTDSVEILKCKS